MSNVWPLVVKELNSYINTLKDTFVHLVFVSKFVTLKGNDTYKTAIYCLTIMKFAKRFSPVTKIG